MRLDSVRGERVVELADLYNNDGIHFLTRQPDEILSQVMIGSQEGWRSTYWKLRRRGSFDFPVLSVAAAAKIDGQGTVEQIRIVLGAVASSPLTATAACERLQGKQLTDDAVAEAAELAGKIAKPMDNTDFKLHWRKRVAKEYVTYALRELRGDDMREIRKRTARHSLESALH